MIEMMNSHCESNQHYRSSSNDNSREAQKMYKTFIVKVDRCTECERGSERIPAAEKRKHDPNCAKRKCTAEKAAFSRSRMHQHNAFSYLF